MQPRRLRQLYLHLLADRSLSGGRKTVAAAASDLERREEMLIEQGLGSSPFIPVLGALWTTIWQARS
jgi:hypothetical protein